MEEKRDTHNAYGRESAIRLSTSKPYFTETIYQNQKKQISDINEKFKTSFSSPPINDTNVSNGDFK